MTPIQKLTLRSAPKALIRRIDHDGDFILLDPGKEPALSGQTSSFKEDSFLLQLPAHHRRTILLIQNKRTTNSSRTPGVGGGVERTSR